MNHSLVSVLLGLICRNCSQDIIPFFHSNPHFIRRFFRGFPTCDSATPSRSLGRHRINAWFDHFSYDGSPFGLGAQALEHYLLAERDKLWQYLSWQDRSVSPIVCAQNRARFTELDVVGTVEMLLREEPHFFESALFCTSLTRESAEFLAIDLPFFISCLFTVLPRPTHAEELAGHYVLMRTVTKYLETTPFETLGQLLLPTLPSEDVQELLRAFRLEIAHKQISDQHDRGAEKIHVPQRTDATRGLSSRKRKRELPEETHQPYSAEPGTILLHSTWRTCEDVVLCHALLKFPGRFVRLLYEDCNLKEAIDGLLDSHKVQLTSQTARDNDLAMHWALCKYFQNECYGDGGLQDRLIALAFEVLLLRYRLQAVGYGDPQTFSALMQREGVSFTALYDDYDYDDDHSTSSPNPNKKTRKKDQKKKSKKKKKKKSKRRHHSRGSSIHVGWVLAPAAGRSGEITIHNTSDLLDHLVQRSLHAIWNRFSDAPST
eukprot:TRINITY_DN7427_c0_g1_i1.p1 TRINITY_DN7427_c0_g1~~TRINITY_DN7427_c0_g1_i1.p1  ORF type:complete len:489 (-),score=38.77 TRINITY_DN7427_c0_g1_i1:212-1678(-)